MIPGVNSGICSLCGSVKGELMLHVKETLRLQKENMKLRKEKDTLLKLQYDSTARYTENQSQLVKVISELDQDNNNLRIKLATRITRGEG